MSEIAELLTEVQRLAASSAYPPDCRYVGIEQIASMLNYSESHVKNRIICAPGFPKPSRIGHPRWKMSEVVEWMDEQR